MKQQRLDRLIAVIEQLGDGHFHSGEAIGQQLNVSRTAVSKYIQEVQKLGIDVFRVTGKGYRLMSPLQLLDAEKIAALVNQASSAVDFEVDRIVTSTNDVVKQRLHESTIQSGFTVFAEAQTAGRGRRGKQWVSPFGSNLYTSFYWRLEQGMSSAMGLSLVIGSVVARVIETLGVPGVELKWPNDILVDGKKIAGVLVELEGQALGVAHAIIGIGINVAMPEPSKAAMDQPWTDIGSLLVEGFDRNKLAALLLSDCHAALLQFNQFGLKPFIQQWQQFDRLSNQHVRIIMGDKEIVGIAMGIDET